MPFYHGHPVDVSIGMCYGSTDAGAGNVKSVVKSVTGMLDHCFNDKWSFHNMVRNYEHSPGYNNYTTVSRVADGPIPTITLSVDRRDRNDRGTLRQNELIQKTET